MNQKVFLMCVFFSLFTSAMFGQERKSDEEKRKFWEEFKAKRVTYISKEVGLTKEESDDFWPICNELQEKKFELNRVVREEMKKVRDLQKEGKTISDSEYDRLIYSNLDCKIKEIELDKEYVKKFRKILSAEKVLKYQRAEQRFAKEMFQK